MYHGYLKLVWVGDTKVGKTVYLIRAAKGYYYHSPPHSHIYVPSTFEDYVYDHFINGTLVSVSLKDIRNGTEQSTARFRIALDYPHTEVFLACFDVTHRASLDSVISKWIPELRSFSQDTPIILVGHKVDLRRKAEQMGEPIISVEEGVALAASLGCVCYKENSALTGKGVADTMHTAIEVAACYVAQKSKWKKERKVSTKTTQCHPLVLPLAEPSPEIMLSLSTFAEDMVKMLKAQSCTDVKFVVSGGPPIEAHRIVLCAASTMFRDVFLEANSHLGKNVLEDLKWVCDAGDKCPNFVHSEQTCSSGKAVITLNPSINPVVFQEVVLFLYKGLPDITNNTDKEFGSEIQNVAEKFQLSWLCDVCKNVSQDEAYLNPSIGTWLNDNTGAAMKEIFLNKDLMSDVKFCLEGNTVVHAHRVVLIARCDVMAAMLGGAFRESRTKEIAISGTSVKCFLALLEYLYTDHAPLEECDPVDLMKLADRFCLPRLVALCELHITRDLEKMMREEAADRACAVIHLLLTAQVHNARQLTKWCLHFISTNYSVFSGLEEFSMLQEEHRKYVEEHRWPPQFLLEALDKYDKATGRCKQRTSRKCKVM